MESSRRLAINRLRLWRLAFPFAVIVGSHGFAAAFDKNVALDSILVRHSIDAGDTWTYLERVFARETLVAMIAGKGLDSQVDSLVPLEIVVAVETLWALVAFEGSVVGGWLLVLSLAHEVRHGSSMAAVEARHDTSMHTYKRESTVWVLHVGEDRRRA